MGLFSKKEKMDLEKASGVIFLMCLITEGRMAQIQLDGIEKEHEEVVRCGYNFGLSIAVLGTKIGYNNIDHFIDLAIKSAEETLIQEKKNNISEYEKYIKKATKWILNESNKYGNDLFLEYAKSYLNDLYNGNDYSNNILNIATQDMMFYYDNWNKVESGIKIIK